MEPLTVRSVIARFETWAIKHLSRGTVLNYRRHLERFAAAVGDVDVTTLRAHHLIEWARTWHEVVSVQRAWNWLCRDAEIITSNPFKNVKRPRLGKRKRIFEPAEQVKLLRACPADFRRYLIALRETIARPQEARVFAWEQLRSCDPALPMREALLTGHAYFELDEFKHRHLRAEPDCVRVIPISPRLGRLLLRLCAQELPAAGLCLVTGRGREWTKEAVRLRMKRLRDRLGYVKDKRGEQVVAYTFRHTAATIAVARGARDRVLAELMGHTTARTTARYQHLQTGHLLDAMRRIRRRRPPEAA